MENENHGVLIRDRLPQEWVVGAESGIVEGNVRDWKQYLPHDESQHRVDAHNVLVFDTNACTHFASGHIYETFVIYLWKNNLLSQDAITFFTKFLTDPKDINSFRVSKQFSAIVGNNTPQGNYFTVAWDTWRNIGAIPDSMLNTLNTSENWSQYHDKSHITTEMMAVAKESLNYVDTMYAWLDFDQTAGFSPSEVSQLQKALATSPINAGIPIPANHSVEMYALIDPSNSIYGLFNTYAPFVSDATFNVNFALQATVKPHVSTFVKPDHIFLKDLKAGDRGAEVYNLQIVLAYEGLLNRNLINQDPAKAFFGTNTLAALIKFQSLYANFVLVPAGINTGKGTGFCGEWTRAFINSKYGHPSW